MKIEGEVKLKKAILGGKVFSVLVEGINSAVITVMGAKTDNIEDAGTVVIEIPEKKKAKK